MSVLPYSEDNKNRETIEMPSIVALDELFDATRNKANGMNGTHLPLPPPAKPTKHNFDDLEVRPSP
jgi:hypothetical protein